MMKLNLIFFFICILQINFAQPTPKFVWANQLTSAKVKSISIDDNENLYSCGIFESKFDANPGLDTFYLTPNGNSDIFIIKYDKNGDFLWAKSIGGAGSENVFSIKSDSEGNLLITGGFTLDVDFNPGNGMTVLNSKGQGDIFILKLNSLGELLWVKSYGGTDSETGVSVDFDNIGNIYVYGWFQNTINFDGFNLAVNNNTKSIFILKLDNTGIFKWVKKIETNYQNPQIDHLISIDSVGDIVITGGFLGTVDFDPGMGIVNLTSNTPNTINLFLLKLSSTGDYIWSKHIKGNSNVFGTSISTSESRDIYITGYAANGSNFDFDPSIGEFILPGGVFVAKYTLNGDLIWSKTFASGGQSCLNIENYGMSIDVNNGGEAILTGIVRCEFLGTSIQGNNDIIIMNFRSDDGNYNWIKRIGGNFDDEGKSISKSKSGNVYVAGIFTGYCYLQSGLSLDLGGSVVKGSVVGKIGTTTTNISLINVIDKKIIIYPNPIQDIFKFEIGNELSLIGCTYQIINSIGQIVLIDKVQNSIQSIDLSKLNSGMYFLEIFTKEKMVSQKLVKL